MKTPKRIKPLLSSSHAHATHQEKRAANRINGRTVRGSGSGNEKGDARKPGVCRVECKGTKHNSFSITQEMLDKIEDAALPSCELPVIQVDFLDDNGEVKRTCAVCPEWVLDIIAETKI